MLLYIAIPRVFWNLKSAKKKKYLINIFDRNQTGFVAGMGTSVNILLLA
jgi:hypothetical protein